MSIAPTPTSPNKTLQWILNLGGTMVGASVSLVGLSKLVEAHRGASHVDVLAGLAGGIFAVSMLLAYLAVRADEDSAAHKRFTLSAEILFGLGLATVAAVGLLFALDFI